MEHLYCFLIGHVKYCDQPMQHSKKGCLAKVNVNTEQYVEVWLKLSK